MSDQELKLIEMVPEFPNKPGKEISRDPYIRWITGQFGPSCQKQMIACGPLTGKTNFMAQFACHHQNQVISYFINSNPMTQDIHTFLCVICNQMCKLLGRSYLPESVGLEQLRSTYTGLAINLTEKARSTKQIYYIIIDGLEWGLQGEKGNRIIDFPLTSFTNSPYILYSCRTEQKDLLSIEGVVIRDQVAPNLEFSLNDTHEYLSEFQLEDNEVKEIHEKAKGLPGYVKIIRDTLQTSGKEWIKAHNLPDNLENLIEKQIKTIVTNFPSTILESLEIIAISPKPILLTSLLGLLDTNEQQLKTQLQSTGIVLYDQKLNTFQISPEFTREVFLKRIGAKRDQIAERLLKHIQNTRDGDELHIALLMQDTKDFDGISSLLESGKIINTWKKTQDTILIQKELHIASQMAYDRKDISNYVKFSLAQISTQAFVSHALNLPEISALIAIGESQEALRRAYTLSESISKIRLLSRAYTAMRENGERIPKTALEEIEVLIGNQNFKELDKDTVQLLAADIFPILPDKAIEILENSFSLAENRSTIESALSVINKGMPEKESISEEFAKITSPQRSFFGRFYSTWLIQQTIEELIENSQTLKNTKAKEYLIRQWCRQNRENPDLDLGIQLWIDTIIVDSSFMVPLRNLRQISNSVRYAKDDQQEKLVRRLEIPSFTSIRTPWEEWVGFNLNLAEVVFLHDESAAKQRIDNIYETINLDINDLDIKVFCYARLWATVSKLYVEIEESVRQNHERVLSSLLKDSALQDEILNKTLQIITPIDIEYAIEKALEMNTEDRRLSAIMTILKTSLRKNPTRDISKILQKVSQYFDDFRRPYLLVNITNEMWERNVSIKEANQEALLKLSRKIIDPTLRAEALFNLAAVWSYEKLIRVKSIVKEAKSAWELENDLKLRILRGYNFIEKIASKDKEAAKEFCLDVQNLKLQPGAELAVGDLGVIFFNTLSLLIESISLQDITTQDEILDKIHQLIDRIPAPLIRIRCYGQFAARSYTVGYPKEAEEIIGKRILPDIDKLDNLFDRQLAIRFCLPVIYMYHKQQAYKYAEMLPLSIRDNSWTVTVVWLLTLGSLRDEVDIEHLKVTSGYPQLKEYALEAAKNIVEDGNLFLSISAICKTIEQSIHEQMIDVIQAYDLLDSLDNLSREKLPDKINIKHEGYLIASLATIHGAKSVVYKAVQKKRGFSKIDIRKKWTDLENAARIIPNLADRVFVLHIIAKEFYKYDEDKAIDLLSEAEDMIEQVPAIVDRSDRLENIGKDWGEFGKKDYAKFTLEKAYKLIEQMGDYSQDKKLELMVQAAYEFSPEFAEEIVMRYDSRDPEKTLSPVAMANEANKLIANPDRIQNEDKNRQSYLQLIMGYSSLKLYNDLVYGHGRIPAQGVLLDWLKNASHCDTETFFNSLDWVQECINRQNTPGHLVDLSSTFIDITNLSLNFASLISPAKQEGMPEDIMNILPGLSSKVTIFRVGEYDKAKKWIKQWLSKNTEDYLKVIDPYFGSEQLTFFTDLPKDCKILIVTTDEYFDLSSQEKTEASLTHVWNQYGKGKIPQINIIIVPKKQEELFHDRVIISKNRGIDIGQSLNGLGTKIGKITDLPYEDAKELEIKYVNEMLNHNSWFLNHNVRPMIVTLGN
jgi:hypothetical protein